MMRAELLSRISQLESELSRFAAELARIRVVHAEQSRPQEIRLARTYDTGSPSYPTTTGSNTFPATLIDATYTETAGTRTVSVTERDTGNVITIHNVFDVKIPVGKKVPVFRQNGRWWTWYGESQSSTTCESLQGFDGYDNTVHKFLVSEPGESEGNCEWQTFCEFANDALATKVSDLNGYVVAQTSTDDCGWASVCDILKQSVATATAAAGSLFGKTAGNNCGWFTICQSLQGITNWSVNDWQLMVHNPQSPGSTTDDTCEWMSVCDFLKDAIEDVTDDIVGKVLVCTDDGGGVTGCGWATTCDLFGVISGYAVDTWQMLIHNPNTTDSGADDSCEWMTPCEFLEESLTSVSSDIVSLVVLTDDGEGATGCGKATVCDTLKSGIDDSAATPARFLGKTAAGNCGWMIPSGGSSDYCASLIQYAQDQALSVLKDWVIKLHHDGTEWTCVAVEVKEACT